MEQVNIFAQKKNFTLLEKKFLLECILEHKNVIENKKTDDTSVKSKQEVWKKITTTFNASTLINEKIINKQLQRLWTSLKLRQRSELVKERQHRMATGGGEAITDTQVDPLIENINPHLIYEISSVNDSDNTNKRKNMCTEN
ncbi:UPF0439 protein C9orf30 like protein [Trachymyrmex zeteki]|uniref:Regulatory protein zeste n=1 Tax=Mycetomoellerius zeteki TaxID=64791 RepID=A0A151X3Y3_9HYME|nr:UPF0439 protein C9orf30 like protein [Trachymyrmex zeteki]